MKRVGFSIVLLLLAVMVIFAIGVAGPVIQSAIPTVTAASPATASAAIVQPENVMSAVYHPSRVESVKFESSSLKGFERTPAVSAKNWPIAYLQRGEPLDALGVKLQTHQRQSKYDNSYRHLA